jgi:hypothetical protein
VASQQTERQKVALRLANTRPDPVTVHLEPWGEQHDMAPGATLELVADGPREDCLELSLNETGVTVWGWPGSVVHLFRDGEPVEGTAGCIPTPETPPHAPPLSAKYG